MLLSDSKQYSQGVFAVYRHEEVHVVLVLVGHHRKPIKTATLAKEAGRRGGEAWESVELDGVRGRCFCIELILRQRRRQRSTYQGV